MDEHQGTSMQPQQVPEAICWLCSKQDLKESELFHQWPNCGAVSPWVWHLIGFLLKAAKNLLNLLLGTFLFFSLMLSGKILWKYSLTHFELSEAKMITEDTFLLPTAYIHWCGSTDRSADSEPTEHTLLHSQRLERSLQKHGLSFGGAVQRAVTCHFNCWNQLNIFFTSLKKENPNTESASAENPRRTAVRCTCKHLDFRS